MPYQWILFDADNTLLDFSRSEREALQLAFEDAGLPFDDAHHALYHRINKACWEAFERGKLGKESLRTRRFELFFEAIGREEDENRFAETYLAFLGQTGHLVEGALSLLQALDGRCRMAVVTNGLKEVQRPRLAQAGIEGFFQAIVVSDEIGRSKPDSAFFEFTFQQIGHPPKESVLMVGDNLHADIQGGQDYGIPTCWFNPSRQNNEGDARPRYEIGRLVELLDIL